MRAGFGRQWTEAALRAGEAPRISASASPARRGFRAACREGKIAGNVTGEAESAMDEFALSLKMQRLTRWLDQHCQPDHLARMQFDAPRFGHCYLTIDTERQGPLASFNLNRVYLCGRQAGMEPGSVAQWTELFA